MAKGLCCAAVAAGDLGKSLRVIVHKKYGTTGERCGVCEIVRSCTDPQKRVFRFKFLPIGDCGILGKTCKISDAMVAQYNASRTEAAGHPVLTYNGTGRNIFAPWPTERPSLPYTLPLAP